eukprot:g78890.t1
MSIHAPSADLLNPTDALNNTLFTPFQPLTEFASLRRVVTYKYVKFNAKTGSVQFRFKYVNLNAPWGWGQAVEICMQEESLPGATRTEPTDQSRRLLLHFSYYCRRHPLEAFFPVLRSFSCIVVVACYYNSCYTRFATWDQALDLQFAPTGPELYQQAQDALDEHLEYVMPFEVEGSGNCFLVQHEGHKFTLKGESNPVNKSSEPVKLDKALAYMFGGDSSKYLVVDFCCGSGSFTLAGLTLGYHTLALDNDVGQMLGFQSRVRKFQEDHVRIMRKALKPPRPKYGGLKGPLDVHMIPFQYGSIESTTDIIIPFSKLEKESKGAQGSGDEDESDKEEDQSSSQRQTTMHQDDVIKTLLEKHEEELKKLFSLRERMCMEREALRQAGVELPSRKGEGNVLHICIGIGL